MRVKDSERLAEALRDYIRAVVINMNSDHVEDAVQEMKLGEDLALVIRMELKGSCDD